MRYVVLAVRSVTNGVKPVTNPAGAFTSAKNSFNAIFRCPNLQSAFICALVRHHLLLCRPRRDAPFVTIIRLSRLAFTLLNMNQLQVKLLSENATLPKKGSPLSAGFDLSSAQDTVIQAGARGLVKTDISVACPPGTYARIAPRSGLAVKKGIDVGAGVVDADYRGPVGVVLFNFGTEDFEVKKGDRIAQLILEQVCMVDAIQVEELDDTVRGTGGFGSTGVDTSLDANPEKKQRTISPTAANEDKVDPPTMEAK